MGKVKKKNVWIILHIKKKKNMNSDSYTNMFINISMCTYYREIYYVQNKKPTETANYLSSSFIVVASSSTSLLSLRKARNSLIIDWYSELLFSETLSSSNINRFIYHHNKETFNIE